MSRSASVANAQLVARVVEHVAAVYEVDAQVVMGASADVPRGPHPSGPARIACWYLLRRFTRMTDAEIAREFGRERSTVTHGIRRFKRMIRTDAAEREILLDAMRVFDPRGQNAMRVRVEEEIAHAKAVLARLERVLADLDRVEHGPRRHLPQDTVA